MDISIKQLNSYVFEPKSEALRVSRAKEIVSQKMTVSEKVDGTKLTLVRTDKSDVNDYANNWIVSYKGTVLHGAEFSHFTDKDKESIERSSTGIGQYVKVFDHLKKINSSITSIPSNTEFSVEFAQNKETLTRTYDRFGGMFLRSYATVRYRVINGTLHTHPTTDEVTKQSQIKKMADILQIDTFPIYFVGKLNQSEVMANDVVGPKMGNVDWSNPEDVIRKFSVAVLTIPSVLGGKIEGVVIQMEDGKFFKVVQPDQYDQTVRNAKKDQYRMTPEETSEYFKKMRSLISTTLSKIDLKGKSQNAILSTANQLLAKTPIDMFPKNSKRNETQVRDDAHETLRLMVDKQSSIGKGTLTIGLIPIAGKPLHIGHWKLIDRASKENDRVIVYTTEKDRVENGQFPIKGEDFVYFWHDYFIPILPKNVTVKFVESPVRSVMHEVAWFEQKLSHDNEHVPTVRLYSDSSDINSNFSDSDLSKFVNLQSNNKIEKIGVDRASTTNISGTKMREFLSNGDHDSFIENLPPVSPKDKEEIWNVLQKNAPTKENPMKEFVNEFINQFYKNVITESGNSVASVDPKTQKTVNGQPAQATTKLKIVDDAGKSIAGPISTDIKNLVLALNGKLNFWKNNNPYIEDGYIFNGSSQHLMNPKTRDEINNYKKEFGDIDVIIPKAKLSQLESYLDQIDDNQVEWAPTTKNKLTTAYYYIGRTKSYAALPDQLVTLWYYVPKKQVVQIDFEGDDMEVDSKGFEKPSDWTKFSKDSPYSDLKSGIKGLAGAILLRTLTRAVTQLKDVVVLTPGGVKKVNAGAKEITDKDVTKSEKHGVPATHVYDPTGGARVAYEPVGTLTLNGKPVKAYKYIEAKDTESRITQIKNLFTLIFGKSPTDGELSVFRSFKGQLQLMKKYLSPSVNKVALDRFIDIIGDESLSDTELQAILDEIKVVFNSKNQPEN